MYSEIFNCTVETIINNDFYNANQTTIILSLMIIFLSIIISPIISNRLRLPVVVIEIILGILFGESLLNIISMNPVLDFLSSFGLIYLMFLVGLEINLREVRGYVMKTLTISLFSILIPFICGFAVSFHVDVEPLLLGTIFTTTSLGIILPLTKDINYSREFNHILLVSVAIVDVISIFLLAFSLSIIEGMLEASFIYSLIAILVLFLLPTLINRMRILGLSRGFEEWILQEHHFEMGVRLAFALIVILAAISWHLGFHSIIGAFIAGLIISELLPEASLLRKKLDSFGYGFFIPLFFIIMGSKVNLPLLFSNVANISNLLIITFIAIISKVTGVFLASKTIGFDVKESTSLGLFHSARVSLIIAAAEIGSELGLISESLFSILIILAVVSALVGPSIGKYILVYR